MYYISHVVIISRKSLIPLKAIFSLRFWKMIGKMKMEMVET